MIRSKPTSSETALIPVRWFWPGIAVCLILQAALAVDCARQWTPTHDEYWHLPIGLRMWKTGRFDDDVINPPPVRLWAALPLALGGALPGDTESRLDVGDIGDAFWSANGEWARFWYFLGRLMIVPMASITGLAIAVFARRWYGDRAALASVVLWACCPTALANASIVTHDLPLAALWALTILALARFAENSSWPRALQFGVALGAALLTKLTAVILIPLSVVLWLILRTNQLFFTRGATVANTTETDVDKIAITNPGRGILFARWTAAFGIALLIVNACYLFQGSGATLGSIKLAAGRLQSIQRLASAIHWIPVPVPGDYIAAIDRLALDLERKHPVYLDGEWRDRPFAWYYADALLYKLSLSTLVLTFIGLVAVAMPRTGSLDRRRGLFLLTAALALPVLASQSSNQIGIRYVLPSIPLLCVLAGQSVRWLTLGEPRRVWNRCVCLGVWAVIASAPLSLRFHPHHLAYFNLLAGGPAEGGWHLLDSNIDWGQDLHALKRYLDDQKIHDVGLAYFGTVIPATIGMNSHEPPRQFPQPGWYAISVNFVYGRPHVLRDARGDRSPVGIQDFSYFRFFKPVATIGYSINVYRLTQQDVARYAYQLQELQRSRRL